MSIVDKLKDFLSPEIDENEVKKPKVEEKPKHEEAKHEVIVEQKREVEIKSDKEEYQFEETFRFPMMVEEDFLEEFTKEEKETKVEEKPVSRQVTHTRDIKLQPLTKKPFKPSPVISPVYGIINEEKVEVLTKQNNAVKPTVKPDEKVTFDTIRQKAYGSLEEDIEKVINDGTDIFFDLEKEEPEEDNIISEFVEDQNDIASLTLEEAEENYEYRGVATDTKKKPNPEDILDLVDEMYEQEDK